MAEDLMEKAGLKEPQRGMWIPRDPEDAESPWTPLPDQSVGQIPGTSIPDPPSIKVLHLYLDNHHYDVISAHYPVPQFQLLSVNCATSPTRTVRRPCLQPEVSRLPPFLPL